MPDKVLSWVCDCLNYAEGTRSRTVKENTLRGFKSHPEGEIIVKELLSVALDWFRHFGVATLPKIESSLCRGENEFKHFVELVAKMEEGHFGRDVDFVMGVLHGFTENEAKWLRRCLQKDLKAGIGDTTVNKVWPGHIKIFECMLAETLEDPSKLGFPVIAEPKIDGIRALCFIKSDERGESATFCSRGGTELFNLNHISTNLLVELNAAGAQLSQGWVLDGELYYQSLQKTLSITRSSVAEIAQEEVKKVNYFVFDILPLSEWQSKNFTTLQNTRTDWIRQCSAFKNDKKSASPIKSLDSRRLKTVAELNAFYEEVLHEGYEGLMIKSQYAVYTLGRSVGWLKYKPYEVEEFKVVGWYPGQGRLTGSLGGFTIETADGVTCDVGGGMTDEQRDLMFIHRDTMPGRIIKVKFKNKTEDKKLREPVFLELIS